MMVESGRCHSTCVTHEDLNEFELNKLEKLENQFRLELLSEWPKILLDSIKPFKKA